MQNSQAKDVIKKLLSLANISVDGNNPWDIRVVNDEFYARVLSGGSLAFGESYMDGWWDVDNLDEFFCRAFMANLYDGFQNGIQDKLSLLWARLFNLQTIARSRQVAESHYNLGNDLFRVMLDDRLSYTCAYWRNAVNLNEAQESKMELVCQKLELKPGMSVLEFGCGWGAFAKYAVENYGVRVLGVNIAEEQVRFGSELCKGLPVELRVQDYREVRGQFDRVVSLGIMEHIGHRNYRVYMENVSRCLRNDGIAFIHSICENKSTYRCDPWFDRYIFPNATTPSVRQLSAAMEGLFVIEDCHNIGPHYDPTLLAWHENLKRGWPQLRDKYGERLYRMMKFYLLSSAGCFRSRRSQVYQFVMTKEGRSQPDCRVENFPARQERMLQMTSS